MEVLVKVGCLPRMLLGSIHPYPRLILEENRCQVKDDDDADDEKKISACMFKMHYFISFQLKEQYRSEQFFFVAT